MLFIMKVKVPNRGEGWEKEWVTRAKHRAREKSQINVLLIGTVS